MQNAGYTGDLVGPVGDAIRCHFECLTITGTSGTVAVEFDPHPDSG
jgi:hypothetical protein